MSQGYSVRLLQLNKAADRKNLGVKLGRMCIKHGVSASYIADYLGVSRQTVYNWFVGASSPKPPTAVKIERYMAKLQQ